jgi:hypothetical protein
MSVLTRLRPYPSNVDPDKELKRWFENEVTGGILTDYWYLPGRPGGQLGYGGNASGEDATISSTRHATKGFVYLGAAQTSGFDETNQRIGLNVAAPAAKLDIAVGPPSVTTSRPSSASSTNAAFGASAGNIVDCINDQSDSTWCRYSGTVGLGATLTIGFDNLSTMPAGPTYTGFNLVMTMRSTVAFPSRFNCTFREIAGNAIFTNYKVGGEANTDTSATYFTMTPSLDDGGYNVTTSFVSYSYSLSVAEVAAVTLGLQLELTITNNGLPGGGLDFDWAEISFTGTTASGGSDTLQKWATPSYDNQLDWTADGSAGATLDLSLTGDAPFRINSGGGTSGLRFLTSSTNGRIEVGTAAQANMTLIASGARDATGTQFTQKFSNVTTTGTITINGGGPLAGDVLVSTDSNGLATWTAPAVAAAHTLLDASYHTDTVAQTPTRGSLVYANATPKWDEMVHPGAASRVLTTTSTDVAWSAFQFTGLDDPSAEIGLAVVNGTATTAMRSDAAPPLDQTISPTWTGAHTWTGAAGTLPIQINQATSQTANLLRVSSVAAVGDSLFRVSSTGEVICGHNGGTQDDAIRKLVVRGNSTQSVDLVAIQGETTTISAFDSVGRLKLFNSTGGNSTTFDRTAAGSNYTITLPNAAPSTADSIALFSTAGLMTFASTIPAGSIGAHDHSSTTQGGAKLLIDVDAAIAAGGTTGIRFTTLAPNGDPIMQFNDATTGFTVDFLMNAAISGDAVLTFPVTGGTVLTTSATQSVTNKAMGTGNTLRATTAASGVAWVDSTDATKSVRAIMTQLVTGTNNAIVFQGVGAATARTWTFPRYDGIIATSSSVVCVNDQVVVHEDDIVVAN